MESALEEVASDAIADAVARAAEYALQREIIPPKKLESFSLRRSRYTYANRQMYRVYDKPNHFVLVEAASAHEAYAKSGISNALKIQRESFFTQVAIAKDRLEEDAERLDLNIDLPSGIEEKRFVDLQSIDAELKAKEKPFEAFLISDIARQNAAAPQNQPDTVQEATPLPVQEMMAAPAEVAEAPAIAPQPESNAQQLDEAIEDVFAASIAEMQAAPEESAMQEEPERALTADEVNALLMGGDDD